MKSFFNKISDSRYCQNSMFYFHSVDLLKLENFNIDALKREPREITFDVLDKDSEDKKVIDDIIVKLVKISESTDVEKSCKIFENIFQLGALCIVARHKEEVVGYNFAFSNNYIITYDDYIKRNVSLRLRHGLVFFGNGYISKKFRLRGIFPYLMKYSIDQFVPGTQFYTSTDVENIISRKSHERLGYKCHSRLTCLSLFFLNFYKYENTEGDPGRVLFNHSFNLDEKEAFCLNGSKLMPEISIGMS